MRASLRLCSIVQPRKPGIHFLGKRTPMVHPPAAHPSAPQEIKDHFGDFLAKIQAALQRRSGPGAAPSADGAEPAAKEGTGAAKGGSTSSRSYSEFWEAPTQYWKRLEMTTLEEEAIMSGGAALR